MGSGLSDDLGDDGIIAPTDQSYRTCSECGRDCMPEPTPIEGHGMRIAFVCPEHGVHSVVDPFEGKR